MDVGSDNCEIIGAQSLGDWFTEDPDGTLVHGQSFSLKIKEILCHQISKYQDILVFERLLA